MTFIQDLYPDGQLNNAYILIWCLQTKRSHWFRSSRDAEGFMATAPKNRDHYVGVGLSPKDFGPKSRCPVKDIAALAGSYVDIDIYHETAHKKTNLPKTLDEAMKIIEGLPTPSYIIHTGHGLQVWWLFNELWHLTDQDELEMAKRFAKSWTDMTRSNAVQYGYDVDSTGDLARVLRIPGTTNNKVPTDPVKVTVYQQNDVRYSKEDLIEQCREHMASANGSKKKHTHFDLDPNAHPPFDKFMALMENNARFKKTFNHARKDLQDQSASSYDYSLAMFAVADGWTDDEIAALLISFRRKHSHDLKLNRSDNYYVRTISKARARHDENGAEKDFKQKQKQDMNVLGKVDVGSISRDEAITVLNERLNISIKRIVKYLTDPPSYRLEMQNGKDIFIPDVGSLIGQTALRRNVAAVANKYVRTFRPAAWDIIAQMLLSACVEENVGTEGTDAGYISTNLQSYLEAKKVIDNIDIAVTSKRPFYDTTASEEYIYFFGDDFRRWLQLTTGDKMSPKMMGIMFKCVGGLHDATYKHKGAGIAAWRIHKDSPIYREQNEKQDLFS